MSKLNLGILGGGQLGSMLASAAKKLNVKTIIYCDDENAPAQKFADDFILGNYNNEKKILPRVARKSYIFRDTREAVKI